MWQYIYTDELYHHGIKGQKWGVRRSEKQLARARGKKKTGDSDSDSSNTKKQHKSKMSKGKKIALGVAAGVLGVMFLSDVQDSLISGKGREIVNNIMQKRARRAKVKDYIRVAAEVVSSTDA